MCLFLLQHHGIFITITLVDLEMGDGDTPQSSYIIQDCLSYPVFFSFTSFLCVCVFPYEADYCPFRSMKNCVVILMPIALNLYIVFGEIATCTILILAIHGH